MGDTVSNGARLVVNKGSNATAVAIAPDVCKLPTNVPQSFGNTAPLPRLGAGKTVRTTIKDQPICVQGSHIGPLSDAAHPGTNAGVKSSTYRFEAEATSWSSNLIIEGKGAVRLADSTIQNHGNTVGLVIAGIHYADPESEEDKAKKRCNLEKVVGICSHGRKLGWPDLKEEGEPAYLEVLLGDKVQFATVRKDITKTPNEMHPKCPENHTHWKCEIVRFPDKSPDVKTKKGVDVWTVDSNWGLNKHSKLNWVLKGGLATDTNPGKETTFKADRAERFKTGDKPAAPPQQPNYSALDQKMKNFNYPPQARAKALQEAQNNHNKAKKKFEDQQKHGKTSIEIDLTDILALWAWVTRPPTMKVTATACSGSKEANLKIFPKDKFSFKFSMSKSRPMRGALAKVKRVILNIRRAADVSKKIWSFAGKNLQIDFLNNFYFEWELQYKEDSKKVRRPWSTKQHTPATVGRDWLLKIGASPLLGIGASIRYSLLNFIAPGAGEAAAKILRRLGTRVDAFFGVSVSVPLEISFGMDNHDAFKFGDFTIGIELKMWGGAEGAVVGVSLNFTISFPINMQLKFLRSTKANTLVEMRPELHLLTKIDLTARAWRVFSWKAYSGTPRVLQIHWRPGKLDVFAPPS